MNDHAIRTAFLLGRCPTGVGVLPQSRVIYALVFPGKRCYIGQTIDPKKRAKAHRSKSGGWSEPFAFHELETICTQSGVGCWFEYAWRHVAHRAGWRVYAEPGRFCTFDPGQVWPAIVREAEGLTWPFSI